MRIFLFLTPVISERVWKYRISLLVSEEALRYSIFYKMPVDIPGFAYAAVVAAGGIFGYYKAGSIPSLGAGILFGSALAYGALEVSRDPSNYSIQLATSSILAGVMGYRFYNSGKIMPAGLVCALSVAMIVRIAIKAAGYSGRSIRG